MPDRGILSMQHIAHLALLGLAGAAGTLLRASCNGLAVRLLGTGFPWGTLVVNVVGSLAFGLVFGMARARGTLPVGLETVLLVGLLGGFTTYSSFAFQSLEMLESGRTAAALAYVAATNAAAIAAVWVGMRFGGL